MTGLERVGQVLLWCNKDRLSGCELSKLVKKKQEEETNRVDRLMLELETNERSKENLRGNVLPLHLRKSQVWARERVRTSGKSWRSWR